MQAGLSCQALVVISGYVGGTRRGTRRGRLGAFLGGRFGLSPDIQDAPWRWGRSGRGRQSRREGAAFPSEGVPFLVRWIFAVSSAVLLAGLVQYSVAQQQIVDRALQDSLRNYGALADELQTALAATSDPSVQEAAVAAELDHIGHSYGTAYVGLFAPDDRLIGESGKEAGRASPDPARLSAEPISMRSSTVCRHCRTTTRSCWARSFRI